MNTRRRRDWPNSPSTATAAMASSSSSNKAALSAAYAELGKELTSGKLRAVGTYTLGRPIGEGTYGKVRLGTHRLTGVRVAIKQVPKAHCSTLTREIHHHRRLHHPNVMQLYEVLATESYIWMVTELCAGGELYDYLVERGLMPEAEARRIFGQLCLAVAYIHNRGIVHRDLKLENVLLDERCNVKLGDFGFTREFESNKLMETFCGTTGYAAPEMLAGRRYTGEGVDVWSLGIILYALVCGSLPFDDDDDATMKAKILKGEYDLPQMVSEECRDLIQKILQLDPASRPTIKEILGHSWFTKVMAPISAMETLDEDVMEPAPPPIASPAPIRQEDRDRMSESSFISAKSKTDSESSGDHQSSRTDNTSPTPPMTDHEEDLPKISVEPNRLSLKHRNESQTTIKRQASEGSAGGGASSNLSSTRTLPTHLEAAAGTTESTSDDEMGPIMALSAPLEKRNSQSSSRGGHHRTPSRTKRRSSGGLSDHHPPSLDFRPIDYISLLEHSTPAIFSTVVEQNLLHQLSALGMDVGQVVHSVVNEACDASGAMWWILKKKAEGKAQVEAETGVNRSRHNSTASQTATLLPSRQPPPPPPSTAIQQDLIRPTAIKAAKASQPPPPPPPPPPADSSERPLSLLPPPPPPSRPAKLSETRGRASSFGARLSSVLSGKDRSSVEASSAANSIRIGDEQFALEDRSKSAGLFGKRSTGTSGKASPNESPSSTPKRRDAAKSSLAKSSAEAAASLSPTESPASGHLQASKSVDTFTTISSSGTDAAATTSSEKKVKPVKSSFLRTFRTWLGADEKEAAVQEQSKVAPKKKKNRRSIHGSSTGTIKRPSSSHSAAIGSHSVSRSGSVRRMQAPPPPPHHHSIARQSISRRSSSGSIQHPSQKFSRPLNVRRPSAGSITPTATIAHGDDFLHVMRHSRPSSSQSLHRGGSLHARSGSAGSSASFARMQSRGSSSGGGTTVRKHRGSRPTTPRRLSEELSMDTLMPARRSLDSPLQTSRAAPTIFVAHRSRTPYKPPPSSSSSSSSASFGTWHRSWGKPPPSWKGAVDEAKEEKRAMTNAAGLRDVFANRGESDDDWEDEDEGPMYAGGLGQMTSSSWGKAAAVPVAPRLESIKGLFHAPSLGSETTPRQWIAEGGSSSTTTTTTNEANSTTLDSSTAPSRPRAAIAPSFKGPVTIEEEEEDE